MFLGNKNIITRAVGVDSQVECDLYLINPNGGYLLLCSDGLSNYMNTEFFLNTVNSQLDISEKTKLLTDYANNCGGADNVTVVLIKL
jgi:protein phosphatase